MLLAANPLLVPGRASLMVFGLLDLLPNHPQRLFPTGKLYPQVRAADALADFPIRLPLEQDSL
jgi:hypothetical protein